MATATKFGQVHGEEFVWGPIVKVHEIGDFTIVEFHPMIFVSGTGTNKYEPKRVSYHIYVQGKDTAHGMLTLDSALVLALAAKYDSPRTVDYALRVLNMGTQDEAAQRPGVRVVS